MPTASSGPQHETDHISGTREPKAQNESQHAVELKFCAAFCAPDTRFLMALLNFRCVAAPQGPGFQESVCVCVKVLEII